MCTIVLQERLSRFPICSRGIRWGGTITAVLNVVKMSFVGLMTASLRSPLWDVHYAWHFVTTDLLFGRRLPRQTCCVHLQLWSAVRPLQPWNTLSRVVYSPWYIHVYIHIIQFCLMFLWLSIMLNYHFSLVFRLCVYVAKLGLGCYQVTTMDKLFIQSYASVALARFFWVHKLFTAFNHLRHWIAFFADVPLKSYSLTLLLSSTIL